MLAVGYAVVPPLVAAAAVWAAGRIRPALGWALHLALIALLVAALVLPPLGDALSGSEVAVALALPVGAAAAFLYARAEPARAFLTVLSPAPLLFLILFVVFSPVSDLVMPGEAAGAVGGPTRSSTPLVHIVLDELPTSTLMGEDGAIDAELFPNLARFAAGATWYRNATSVSDTTPEAVPAQLTGERPRPGELPTSAHHPRSLFTLFSRSHDFTVNEPITDVCPGRLCPEDRPSLRARLSGLADDLWIVAQHLLLPDDLREGLPAVDRGWQGFAAEGDAATTSARGRLIGKVIERLRADDAGVDFARVIAGLDHPSERPPLVFMHSTLPHGPSHFLPDGRDYPIHRRGYPGFARGQWTSRQWLVDQSFQRHVLQTQYTDALVGRLLDKLRAAGLYDKAAIVLTADHGVSFRARQPRRRLTPETFADIALVPFIVKLPGQRTGRVEDGAVRTVDVLPTLADAAGVRVPWRTDGMPADRRPVDPTASIDVTDDGKAGHPDTLGRLIAEARKRNEAEAPLLRHGVYALGPRPDLIGDRADRVAPADEASATVDAPAEYADIPADSPTLPAFVTGDVTGLAPDAVIAIAVNGRVEATTRVYPGDEGLQYSAMLRPDALRAGRNVVTVLQVLPGDELRELGATG